MEPYKHDYSGNCAPGSFNYMGNNTFSVGIFQWVPSHDPKKGLKHSAVKVRVSGYVSNPEAVYKMAEAICKHLDDGDYIGPKNVKVK